MKCSNCGHEIDSSVSFCTYCGYNMMPKKEKARIIAVKIIAACVAFCCLAVTSENIYNSVVDKNWIISEYVSRIIVPLLIVSLYIMVLINYAVKFKKITIILLSASYLICVISSCNSLLNSLLDNSIAKTISDVILSVIPYELILIVGIIINKPLEKYAAVLILMNTVISIIIEHESGLDLSILMIILISGLLPAAMLLIYPVFTQPQKSLRSNTKQNKTLQ